MRRPERGEARGAGKGGGARERGTSRGDSEIQRQWARLDCRTRKQKNGIGGKRTHSLLSPLSSLLSPSRRRAVALASLPPALPSPSPLPTCKVPPPRAAPGPVATWPGAAAASGIVPAALSLVLPLSGPCPVLVLAPCPCCPLALVLPLSSPCPRVPAPPSPRRPAQRPT